MGSTLPKILQSNENNFDSLSLVWLDDLPDDNQEYSNAQGRLRTKIRHIKLFKDSTKCKHYIKSLQKGDRFILIINDRLAHSLLPKIHSLQQLSSIYIRLTELKQKEIWQKQFTKVECRTLYTIPQ